jgi:hypothetical protein
MISHHQALDSPILVRAPTASDSRVLKYRFLISRLGPLSAMRSLCSLTRLATLPRDGPVRETTCWAETPTSCGRAFFETHRVRGNRDPGLRRPGPDMPLNLEPVGIVEGASRYPPYSWPPFDGPHDGGSTPGTEFHSKPAIAFVGTMLVSDQRSSGHLDLLHLEQYRLRKSATGSTLAERAVADRRQHRGANGSIAHAAAQTTSFVDFTHGLRSGLVSFTSRGSDPALVCEKPWSVPDYFQIIYFVPKEGRGRRGSGSGLEISVSYISRLDPLVLAHLNCGQNKSV